MYLHFTISFPPPFLIFDNSFFGLTTVFTLRIETLLCKYALWLADANYSSSFWKRISPVQLSDSGVYTCMARSQAGLAELSYDVQVQGTGMTVHHFLLFSKTICRGVASHCVGVILSASWCGPHCTSGACYNSPGLLGDTILWSPGCSSSHPHLAKGWPATVSAP